MPKEKAKPIGQAINWTPADIERLASITDEDVNAAKATAKRLMPKRTQKLLNTPKREKGQRT